MCVLILTAYDLSHYLSKMTQGKCMKKMYMINKITVFGQDLKKVPTLNSCFYLTFSGDKFHGLRGQNGQ